MRIRKQELKNNLILNIIQLNSFKAQINKSKQQTIEREIYYIINNYNIQYEIATN